MKKLLLTLFAACGILATNAQFYQHLYGTTRNEIPRSGQNTNPAGPLGAGHVMTGSTAAFNGPSVDVTLTRTDLNGNIAVGYFNNAYVLTTTTGVQLTTQGTRVIELANNNFVVVGNFVKVGGGGAPGVFIATFTPAGVMIGVKAYTFVTAPVSMELTSVRQSISAPGDVLVCGDAIFNATVANPSGMFAMRINVASLNAVWSRLYSIQCSFPGGFDNANDIIESPYLPNGVNEAVIVGHTRSNAAVLPDAYFLEVSMATGIPCAVGGVAQIWATPTGGDDRFYSIDVANNAFGIGPGFIVSGYTNGYNVNYDYWALKMNQTGTATGFETTTDYAATGTQNNYAFDAIERLNTNGRYEYYVTGYVDNGYFGAADAVTDKLAANGIAVALGEFTYGGSGADSAHEVDMYNVAGPIGLTTFARTNGSFAVIGAEDFYTIKSYFSGCSGCNEKIVTPPSRRQTTPVRRCPVRVIDTLRHDTLDNQLKFPMTDNTLCYAIALPGCSNARLAPDADDGSSGSAIPYPNPVDATSGIVQLNYQSAVDGNVTVRLFDITGRVCSEQIISVITGDQTLMINLGSGLSTGIYQLQITNGNVVTTTRIAVK